jgi:hypothetical protein
MSLIGLTETDLAPLAAAAKTEIDRVVALDSPTPAEITAQQAPGFDPSSVSYCTINDLFKALQSGYDLGISTYVDLGTHVKVYLSNSALMTPDNLQRLRFLTIDSRIRAVQEDNPEWYSSSQTITVPDWCSLLKLRYQAKGGASGTSQNTGSAVPRSAGGGGGGAYVYDFELGVTPGQDLVLTVASTYASLGPITIQSGGDGESYNQYPPVGGLGGKVLNNGVVVDDGVTAVAGTDGGVGSTYTVEATGTRVTSNGKQSGAGGGSDSNGYYFLGAGGGASGTSNGEDRITLSGFDTDDRTKELGAGAASADGVTNSSVGYDSRVQSQTGGDASPFLYINFVRQPA